MGRRGRDTLTSAWEVMYLVCRCIYKQETPTVYLRRSSPAIVPTEKDLVYTKGMSEDLVDVEEVPKRGLRVTKRSWA